MRWHLHPAGRRPGRLHSALPRSPATAGHPELEDAGERNLRDLLTLVAVQQIASELFDGDMRERIRDVVRTGLTTRYASQLPGGVTLGEELRERRS